MGDKVWIDFEDHLLNIQVTKKRISKLKVMYNIVKRALNLETAGRKEIEAFVNNLNRNKFVREDNKPYSGSSKSDIKKFLKQYYKHTKGRDEIYPPEVSWIKTKIAKDEKPKEKPILEKDQVIKLAIAFKKYEFKILTLLLFDSGFRIQEILSCKKKDLTWETFEDNKKCFWLKCNESKTFKRNVPIPLFTDEIKGLFESSYYKALDKNDLLFNVHYESYVKMLKAHSVKLFNLIITPHCLRHSSATYYAKHYSGNVPLLAQRFGWNFSAKELQTYVRTSGAYNREGAKISFRNELLSLKEENEILKEKVTRLEKSVIVIKKLSELNPSLMNELVKGIDKLIKA